MAQPVFLITGASSGLGKAVAERLARSGEVVVGTSRSAPAAGEAASIGFIMLPLDVRDQASVDLLRDRMATLDLYPQTIILNAGYGVAGALEETPIEAAMAQLDTNLLGAHRVLQAFLPGMRHRGGGHVIVVGSLAGRIALPFQGFYSASKAALASYAAALRMELRSFGITVTLVEPGDHCTGFTSGRQFETTPSSTYEPQQSRVLAAMVASEESSAHPDSFARLVARIGATHRPRPVYIKASLFERMFVVLRRVLPPAGFEAVLRRAYGL